MTEHEDQVALMEWAAWKEREYPELALLFAIPNGGARHVVVARRLKAEGVKAGVPDLMLPVARGGYHGLFVELKAKGGHPTREQRIWIADLGAQGYHAVVARGFEAARNEIIGYLAMDWKKGERRVGAN